MMTLDTSKHACVGATKERLGGKTAGHAEYRCEGCGKKIYVVRSGLTLARIVAEHDGTAISIVCIKCAEPWMKKIASDGGVVAGQRHVVEQDVEPTIMRHREDNARRN